jgi:hypothetical protein
MDANFLEYLDRLGDSERQRNLEGEAKMREELLPRIYEARSGLEAWKKEFGFLRENFRQAHEFGKKIVDSVENWSRQEYKYESSFGNCQGWDEMNEGICWTDSRFDVDLHRTCHYDSRMDLTIYLWTGNISDYSNQTVEFLAEKEFEKSLPWPDDVQRKYYRSANMAKTRFSELERKAFTVRLDYHETDGKKRIITRYVPISYLHEKPLPSILEEIFRMVNDKSAGTDVWPDKLEGIIPGSAGDPGEK